jgi:hypothetical protein
LLYPDKHTLSVLQKNKQFIVNLILENNALYSNRR